MIWGLVPLFWKQLVFVSVFETVAHRISWAALIYFITWRIRKYNINIEKKKWFNVVACALLIAINWSVFVYAMVTNRVVSTSLGYFMSPLVSVFMGYVFLRERLSPLQYLAVFLAIASVLYMSLSAGSIPWISLSLALSFGAYGLVKKKAGLNPYTSMTLETWVMLPLAAVFFYLAYYKAPLVVIYGSVAQVSWLPLTGVVTVLPLLFYSAGVTKVRLSTAGLLQYLAPSMTFLLGVFLYHEPMPTGRILAFCGIWLALLMYSVALYRQRAR